MFQRLTSAVLGILVALAGIGILAYTAPSATDLHWPRFEELGRHMGASTMSPVVMGAFMIIGVGAFFMSYRLLKFAIMGHSET